MFSKQHAVSRKNNGYTNIDSYINTNAGIDAGTHADLVFIYIYICSDNSAQRSVSYPRTHRGLPNSGEQEGKGAPKDGAI